ncbi:unnamed protein product [Caenorhabditis bovis]|uniref:Innexin n=1 Tax=Caenorhabditis bovis TaxID=2654633 RepID=A0A8S1F8C9_9PELO|nr:unnamed protein product [Caenorhabditis bovis]
MPRFLQELQLILPCTIADTFAEVLNWLITPFILFSWSFIIIMALFLSNPISCPDKWEYIDPRMCFIIEKNANMTRKLLDESVADKSFWVPYFFVIQGLSFIIGKLAWMVLQRFLYLPVQFICETSQQITFMNVAERRGRVVQMANLIMARIDAYKLNWVVISALLVRLIYLANVLLQMNLLLMLMSGIPKTLPLIEDIFYFLTDVEMTHSWTLNRVTYCNLPIDKNGTTMTLLNCSISGNVLINGVFKFIFIWLVLVEIATINYLIRVVRIRSYSNVKRFLKMLYPYIRKNEIEKFKDYLRRDGLLLIGYANDQSRAVACELTAVLYDRFAENQDEVIIWKQYTRN